MHPAQDARYQEALNNTPPPGRGENFHPYALTLANKAKRTGRTQEEAFQDIRQAIPPGGRRVPDREIRDALRKAYDQECAFTPRPRLVPVLKSGANTLKRLIAQGGLSDEVDVWEESPINMDCTIEETRALFLATLFEPEEYVFIGERTEPGIIGKNIRIVAEWCAFFRAGGVAGPQIIINPLDGIPRPKKDGGETLRGDANVKAFRHCLVEFDNLSHEDQFRFWSAAKLPIKALIGSGGKSIHAWLDVQQLARISSAEEWETHIRRRLYEQLLIPMGVDRSCQNESRLSRLPGCFRIENNSWQRLIWLSPEGKPLCGH